MIQPGRNVYRGRLGKDEFVQVLAIFAQCQFPYLEKNAERPRGVIGMFDVSARPFVPENRLTFSVPMNKFVRMIDNMEASFLITSSWAKVQKRIK